MVVACLGCLGGLALAVGAVRDRIDAQAAAESVRLVAGRLADLRVALSTVANDYNHWTEAFERTQARDVPWLAENYAITATSGTLFDGLVLFGGPFDAPLAWEEGGPDLPGPSTLPPEVLARVAAEVRRQPLGARATFDALLVRDGRLVLLSATRTQAASLEAMRGLPPEALPIAVLLDAFDAGDAGDVVRALRLPGLAFSVEPAPGLVVLPLAGPDGEALGALAWPPPRPGSALVAAMAPVLGVAGLAFLALGGVAAALAQALARRLVEGEARARALARTDPLTGLPNRLAFTERLGAAEGQAAVLFIDLNGFKRINDTIGHAGGDAVVAALAQRLSALVGPGCFLARVGGDEFVFVLTGVDGVAARAGRLTQEVQGQVAEPFGILGRSVRLSLAQGLALRDGPGVPMDELVRRADLAMYRAKRDRAAEARPYSPDLDGHARRDRELEAALRGALARPAEIAVAYQPIVCARTHAMLRAEALARWTSASLGPVGPDRFVPAAEAAGLIGPLGALLLDRVCADVSRAPGLRVAVNLSPLQLQDPGFPAEARAILARHGVAPARIELELTEGVMIDQADAAALRLDALREMGFALALDDFGTGFSSIGYLMRMPFDTLKIDRSFLGREGGLGGGDEGGVALVRAIARLGHVIGKTVVCEGVETEAQALALRDGGCDQLQGFWCGRPMPFDRLLERMGRAA